MESYPVMEINALIEEKENSISMCQKEIDKCIKNAKDYLGP